MTLEQFNNHRFSCKDKVQYKKNEYFIKAIDFDSGLIGFYININHEIKWVHFSYLELTK